MFHFAEFENRTKMPGQTIHINSSPLEKTHALTRTAMFSALLAVGAYIVIPMGPTHFTMQSMMVMLTGFCLGPRRAFLALVLYLAAGFIGLPVFGRGRAGPATLIAPTGGYYFGFAVGAVVCGFAARMGGSRRRRVLAMIAAGIVGSCVTLTIGAVWLHMLVIDSWWSAFLIGAVPFIPIEILKLGLAICIKEAFFPPKGEENA